ncbi:MAG: pre-peptidase C-terminal domain-containing protein, partial [Spirochaetota bacterium]
MKIKRKNLAYLVLSILLVLILSGCTIMGCDGIFIPYASISGVLSVPITGEQIYETDDFDDIIPTTNDISYGDTIYGLINSTDDIDCFRFSGNNNDTIIIDIDAEAIGSALDSEIYLYNSSEVLIASNDDYPEGATHDPANYIFTYDSHIEIENLPASAGDIYYIVVKSFGGQSSGSYQLRLFKISSVGGSIASTAALKEAEFVPDEIIVKYREGFDTESAKSFAEAGEYIVVNSDNNTHNGALELLKMNISAKSLMTEAILKERTLAEIERLNNLPYVEYAEPNYIMKPLFIPDDQYYSLQWHYPIMKWDMVWDEDLVTDTGSVIVAVIDTGIARSNGTKSGNNHPDLWGNN